MTTTTEEFYQDIETFDDLDISEDLLRGIYGFGFEIPSAIQRKAILPIIKKRDIIAQAQSGTGKTASFLIGSMARVDKSLNEVQVIIICPNRELANQIKFNFDAFNTYLELTSALIMGGTSVEENFRKLDKGVQVVIGTPGRIYDMMRRYALKTNSLKCFVMDEADEMLSRGFKDQLCDIFRFVSSETQVCLFSATMPDFALEITGKFMNNPLKILVQTDMITLEGIKQYYLGVEQESYKIATLYDLYDRLRIKQTIIFVNSKRKADYLKDQLEAENHVVSVIHASRTQTQRDETMKDFRLGNSRVLIATDIIARGIDVQQVEVVINYDIPKYVETYIHRIGRSGRFGRKGIAINLVTEEEFEKLTKIQNHYRTEITPLPENIKSLIG
uniref:RNA helicase n=1 Tax=viral metagenome TaxID=1070528 RepID=A0A6C0B5U5_9ZZZZ